MMSGVASCVNMLPYSDSEALRTPPDWCIGFSGGQGNVNILIVLLNK